MNSPRRQQAPLGVLPAHERLDALDRTRREADDRLEVQYQLALRHRVLQLGLQAQVLHRDGVQRLVEHLVAVAARTLGAVHREVRVAQQVAALPLLLRHPDARTHGKAPPLQLDRLL